MNKWAFFRQSVSVCVGVEFACTIFCALGDGGGAYFKLHIGINISAILVREQWKENIHGSCNFLKGDGRGGGMLEYRNEAEDNFHCDHHRCYSCQWWCVCELCCPDIIYSSSQILCIMQQLQLFLEAEGNPEKRKMQHKGQNKDKRIFGQFSLSFGGWSGIDWCLFLTSFCNLQ